MTQPIMNVSDTIKSIVNEIISLSQQVRMITDQIVDSQQQILTMAANSVLGIWHSINMLIHTYIHMYSQSLHKIHHM